jgi:hypothetical protein
MDEDNEPRVIMPAKLGTQNREKKSWSAAEKQKALKNNNVLESDVDLSAITPDGKNPEKTVIKPKEK